MSFDGEVVSYDDVKEVIDEFEQEYAEIAALLEAAKEEDKPFVEALTRLCECADEVQYYSRAKAFDLSDGEVAVRDDYFETYVQELCGNIGDTKSIPDYIVIDWAATAENIQQDYSSREVDGETYWVR